MRFRLSYAGPLLSSGNDHKHKKSDHKHDLRRAFHPQLKRLWETVPFLRKGRTTWNNGISWADESQGSKEPPSYDPKSRAARFQIRPWNFVPLVTQDMEFHCGIEILFMKVGHTMAVFDQGDLDGRIKTLLDALSIPDANQGYSDRKFERNENPLYVLLENDRQVTKVAVETDHLLEAVDPLKPEQFDVNDARLLINVHLTPVEPASWSLPFVSP